VRSPCAGRFFRWEVSKRGDCRSPIWSKNGHPAIRNEADLEDLPEEVRQEINFRFCRDDRDVLETAIVPEGGETSPTPDQSIQPSEQTTSEPYEQTESIVDEDDHTMVILLRTLLSFEGFEVAQLDDDENLEIIMDVVRREMPDAILLDVHLARSMASTCCA